MSYALFLFHWHSNACSSNASQSSMVFTVFFSDRLRKNGIYSYLQCIVLKFDWIEFACDSWFKKQIYWLAFLQILGTNTFIIYHFPFFFCKSLSSFFKFSFSAFRNETNLLNWNGFPKFLSPVKRYRVATVIWAARFIKYVCDKYSMTFSLVKCFRNRNIFN